MTVKRLTNDQRWDFAGTMANRTYKKEIEAEKALIADRGDLLMNCLTSPDTRKRAKTIPANLMFRSRDIRLTVNSDYFNSPKEKYGQREYIHITVSMPEAIPMMISPSHRHPFNFAYSDDDLKKALGDSNELWYVLDSHRHTYQDCFLVPLEKVIRLTNQKLQLRGELYKRLRQINTLKQLEQVAPELYKEWVAYFGEGVATGLPAVKFDDLLAVMKKEAA